MIISDVKRAYLSALLLENCTWKCQERIPIGNRACWEDSSYPSMARALRRPTGHGARASTLSAWAFC